MGSWSGGSAAGEQVRGGRVVDFPVGVDAEGAVGEAAQAHADPPDLVIGGHGEADRDGERLASARARAVAEVGVVELFATVGDGRFRPAVPADRQGAALLVVDEDAEGTLPAPGDPVGVSVLTRTCRGFTASS